MIFQTGCTPAITAGKPIPLSTRISELASEELSYPLQVLDLCRSARRGLVISAPWGFDCFAVPASKPSSFPRRPANNIRDTPAVLTLRAAFRAIKLAAFLAGRVRGSPPWPAVGWHAGRDRSCRPQSQPCSRHADGPRARIIEYIQWHWGGHSSGIIPIPRHVAGPTLIRLQLAMLCNYHVGTAELTGSWARHWLAPNYSSTWNKTASRSISSSLHITFIPYIVWPGTIIPFY